MIQPLETLQVPNAMLKVDTVIAVTGLSRTTIYRMMSAGDFPQPKRFGSRCTRWRAGDVAAWLALHAEGSAGAKCVVT